MSTSSALPVSLRRKFWLFTLLTIIFMIIMRKWIEPLTGEDIIRFELAKTLSKATVILEDWRNRGLISLFNRSIYLDFIFIVLYTATIFFGCRFVSKLSGHYILQKAGYGFSWLAPLAGICDILENAGMLKTVNSSISSAWVVKFTYHMSVAKFSMLMIAGLYIVVCFVIWVIGKFVK